MTREQLLDPASCEKCHPDHVREWSASMHAYAADDPVFLAMNKRGQRETRGKLGDFCVKCHAPMALLEGATSDGLNLPELPRKLKGVTCYFCHTVASVMGDHNNQLRLTGGTTMLGSLRDPVKNKAHPSAYSSLQDSVSLDSAKMCGSCHDVVNDKGLRVERTFAEWQTSPFAQDACSRCHMKRFANPVAGKRSRRHGHGFAAIDLALEPSSEPSAGASAQRSEIEKRLAHAIQSALCVTQGPDGPAIRVVVNTLGVGHSLPSGAAQHRRLWAEVIAYREGQIIYQSGVVAQGQAVATADPDAWRMGDCLLDAQGNPVHMFWQAVSRRSNTLPPHVPVVQYFPRNKDATLAGLPDRVTLRLRLRAIGIDVLDDLVQSGDLAASVRDAMPTIDIDLGAGPTLEWTPKTAVYGYLEDDLHPATCISLTQLNLSEAKVDAPPLDCR